MKDGDDFFEKFVTDMLRTHPNPPAPPGETKIGAAIRLDDAICRDCAMANGATWPDGHVATSWSGECSVCGKETGCCATSDWNWPKHGGLKADREF